VGALVFRGTRLVDGMTNRTSWWNEAGRELARQPELLDVARGIRGFHGGARWMDAAMTIIGWRMPPFRENSDYERLGLEKYGICILVALAVAAVTQVWWLTPIPALLAFYAAEAQMVFLFPERLLNRRAPWSASRAMTVSAGGTWRVMTQVLPVAARMLTTGWWRGRGRETWVQGCLAVVLWHRHIRQAHAAWVENPEGLPRLEIGPAFPFLLRRERVDTGGSAPCRILFLSDLHWRGPSDAETLRALCQMARREKPDVCILGGDYVECAAALPMLATLVRCLSRTCPCVVLPGNHDLGRFAEAIPETIRNSGGQWLPDNSRFTVGNVEIVTVGAPPPEPGKTRIVIVHDPADLDRHPVPGVAVVFAGHLHGGQWVLSSHGG
jgi:predicted phosphodiesterase